MEGGTLSEFTLALKSEIRDFLKVNIHLPISRLLFVYITDV